MDFVTPVLICLFIFLMCTLCGYCCRRKHQGAIFSTPVIVTSTTTTTPGGYPITVQSTPGGGLLTTPYPTTMPMPQSGHMMVNPPYSTHGGPMPQPYSAPRGYPSSPPYPPGGAPGQMNPPSYDQVVGSDAFQKQAPYNPNYTGN